MNNDEKINSLLIFLINFLIIFQTIQKADSALTCEPDYKSIGDNYSSFDDPQDTFEYFYGYEFAHRAGGEYYDHWKGIYWDGEQFCYEAYYNETRPSALTDSYTITSTDVVAKKEDIGSKTSYILIEHDQTNLINFHNQMCMTKPLEASYNHGEHEVLIKMDRVFEEKFLETPHHFIFTIENPSNDEVTFSFKARNFINFTEEMTDKITETETVECPEVEEENDDNSDSTEDESTKEETPAEPCVTDVEKVINWTETYPIPEVFYFTNNYTIEPHSSRIINASLTFEKNKNDTEGGYFIISEETGQKSEEPFYWPGIYQNNGKIEKLTNMEIILESDKPVGISSFSLMRRRDFEESSYLGEHCNNKYINDILNGRCGDGFYCQNPINGTCEQCTNRLCKNCGTDKKTCTECFMISVEGQWNIPGGKANSIACDLDYIDITKVLINGGNKIEVPPAIHWRVTMDFWIWISDTSALSDANINMNIVYKDFMALTLRCFPEGLRIYEKTILSRSYERK